MSFLVILFLFIYIKQSDLRSAIQLKVYLSVSGDIGKCLHHLLWTQPASSSHVNPAKVCSECLYLKMSHFLYALYHYWLVFTLKALQVGLHRHLWALEISCIIIIMCITFLLFQNVEFPQSAAALTLSNKRDLKPPNVPFFLYLTVDFLGLTHYFKSTPGPAPCIHFVGTFILNTSCSTLQSRR